MKISELIVELQEIQEQHGDLECIVLSHNKCGLLNKVFAAQHNGKIRDKMIHINDLCFLDDELF